MERPICCSVMKRKAVILLLLVSMLAPMSGFGFSARPSGSLPDYTCKFYEAYISGQMEPWPGWIDQLEAEYKREDDPELLHDMLIAYYGYVAWLIGVDRHDRAKDYLEEAGPYLDVLDDHASYRSYAEALKGAFLAYEIGMNRSKAVWLGPRSIKHINRAVELNDQNPVAWMEKGNAEYHMPRIFGGSYKKAAEYYRKAVQLFETGGYNLSCNWRYLNALAWLAQSYDKADMDRQSLRIYRKIMDREPDFQWVRDELFPAFKKDHDLNGL